jgi:metal-responsive CopG/Arc/MetJ family transcriptional regulator
MANIKTAISLQQTLFEQVEALAREMKVSRSRVFSLAVEAFVRRNQNQQLLDKINQAYADAPEPMERRRQRAARRSQRRMVEREW